MTTLATRPVEPVTIETPAQRTLRTSRRARVAAAVALKLTASVGLTLAFAELMSPMG